MPKKHILVIAAGSGGRRHLRNLSALGCHVSAMDLREDRLKQASSEVPLVKTFKNFQDALNEAAEFDGAVVATPPKFHVQQCIELAKAGLPILLEKPLSLHYSEGIELQENLSGLVNPKLLMGYTFRWWPPLHEFRERILNKDMGTPLHAKFVMSAHLADWHPWERYQDFFMASKELGGGALLDESHFLDLMLWFFGIPNKVLSKVEHNSTLEIETDDNVDMIAIYDHGLRVTMHLDLYGRPHEKFISVTGEKGTLKWSVEPNCIQFSTQMEHNWEEKFFQYERNDMFVNVAKEFLEVIEGRNDMSCRLQDGLNALKIIEACRESSLKECFVSI